MLVSGPMVELQMGHGRGVEAPFVLMEELGPVCGNAASIPVPLLPPRLACHVSGHPWSLVDSYPGALSTLLPSGAFYYRSVQCQGGSEFQGRLQAS